VGIARVRIYRDVALEIEAGAGAVTRASFTQGPDEGGDGWAAAAAQQLREYLRGEREVFDVPLAPAGTEFQQEVWRELRLIPFGETCSYAQIAEAIGRPGLARAVGAANGANPIAIFIPCHRVIGAGGRLTGYGGGLELKRFLLILEGALPADGEGQQLSLL
jgi:methylated-DNA-[protein]-cysteine S-methyltransferase